MQVQLLYRYRLCLDLYLFGLKSIYNIQTGLPSSHFEQLHVFNIKSEQSKNAKINHYKPEMHVFFLFYSQYSDFNLRSLKFHVALILFRKFAFFPVLVKLSLISMAPPRGYICNMHFILFFLYSFPLHYTTIRFRPG